MRAAANYAWCNRQLLTHQAREVFARVFGKPWEDARAWTWSTTSPTTSPSSRTTTSAAACRKQVCVHRKGATRAFPPGPSRDPRRPTQAIGQPVIIPGSMGTASWVLAGQPGSMEQSFGTTCHGAGRMMSRTAAVKLAAGRRIDKELDALGIIARARGHKGLAEEQPAAYKDVDQVVEVVDKAGISKKVARLGRSASSRAERVEDQGRHERPFPLASSLSLIIVSASNLGRRMPTPTPKISRRSWAEGDICS